MLKLLIVAVLTGLAGAAVAEGARMVEGAAAYRERIALPGNAVLSVEIRDADGEFFAGLRRRTNGRQVPLAFSLKAPSGAAATLRATVEVDGAVRWSAGPIEFPAGSAAYDAGVIVLRSDIRPPAPIRFSCGGKEIEMTFTGDAAEVTLDGETLNLVRARSGSGARYEAQGDPSVSIWLKGTSAMVSVGGETLPECAEIGAAPNFRAVGVEPGWDIAFTGDRVALTTGYGAERREAVLPPPEKGRNMTIYVIAALDATVRIENSICRDLATGMPHPKTVVVELGERRLDGCGGAPLDLLTGAEWLVEDIGGAGVIDNSHATITFGADWRASGSATCNRFSADFTLTGETLSFGRAAVTMMACPEALMNQERRFTEALERVAGFDINPTGALNLKSADGAVLLRARRD
ncbi:META domain-containing protein [Pikeienuella piscinae]|uniref:META domain-containing protein n=1 Tax=Pikeienuella piscinae TaxID=2748098 RepID=A0A7M3T5S5_9RHOB|nr:META domain-containing protein [Pikeienuella piscinae]QIE57356.1 META domain-containing protein [Pikeienuella piscinae]